MRYVTQFESVLLLYLVIFAREINTLEEALRYLDDSKHNKVSITLNKINKADIEAVRVYTLYGLDIKEVSKITNKHSKTVKAILKLIEEEE